MEGLSETDIGIIELFGSCVTIIGSVQIPIVPGS
jgi:hypothetical protein